LICEFRLLGVASVAGNRYFILRYQVKMVMIEVIANDRLGKKVRVKVDSDDTVEVLKVMAVSLEFPRRW
jgi:hypothetical protein